MPLPKENPIEKFLSLAGRNVIRIVAITTLPIVVWSFQLLSAMSTDVAVMKSQMSRVELVINQVAEEVKTTAVEEKVDRSKLEEASRRLTSIEELIFKQKR